MKQTIIFFDPITRDMDNNIFIELDSDKFFTEDLIKLNEELINYSKNKNLTRKKLIKFIDMNFKGKYKVIKIDYGIIYNREIN
jgi:hypothetical protein